VRIQKQRQATTGVTIPARIGASAEINYGEAPAPDFGPLARDKVPVRAMRESDLPAIVTIDRRITGHNRSDYFKERLAEALFDSDVRVSLVAERDGLPVGFIMARVDLGEFGRFEAAAVLDTIGVDPDCRGQGVGRALLSQLLMNLNTLRIERVRTEIDWRDRELLGFLDHCGFLPSQELCFDRLVE
jgi:ribosomal protein S18 acetylase RimI-like enzyme